MNEYNSLTRRQNARLQHTSAKKQNRTLHWARERIISILLLAMFGIGVCLLAYPSFSDYWNSFHQSRAVSSYAESVAGMDAKEYERILSDARRYNEALAEHGITWIMPDEQKTEYEKLLDITGTGVMGYIKIQKIDVTLPIYHGTEESVLQTSIGHLEQSSFPVRGESVHCMLSGHRGLPSARLFTDLDKLKEGDTFTITTLNETINYEVDHIWIVEPEDLSHLTIEKGKELCSLITCTPYGINSHRLIVRGHRIENVNGDAMVIADAIQIRPVFIAPFLAIPILLLLLGYVMIRTSVRWNKKRDYADEYLTSRGLSVSVLDTDEREGIIEAIRIFLNKRKRYK